MEIYTTVGGIRFKGFNKIMAYKKPMPVVIESRLLEVSNAIKRMASTTIYRNCLNCNEWNEDKEECKRFNARPPAAVIVYSCEQWEELKDWEIPF